MTFQTSNGWWNDTVGVTAHHNKIAAITGPAWLQEIDIQGYAQLSTQQFALTNGVYPQYNISAGVQIGATGYPVHDITDGTGAGASWVVFSEGIPGEYIGRDVPGTSPTNVMERVGYPYNLHWRGLLYVPVGYDLYWVVGLQTLFTPLASFESMYSFWVGYSN